MKQSYITPMLQVVSIRRTDILTTSPVAGLSSGLQDNDVALSPDRLDIWEVY